MIPTLPFKRLILRAVLRQVSPMVIRLIVSFRPLTGPILRTNIFSVSALKSRDWPVERSIDRSNSFHAP